MLLGDGTFLGDNPQNKLIVWTADIEAHRTVHGIVATNTDGDDGHDKFRALVERGRAYVVAKLPALCDATENDVMLAVQEAAKNSSDQEEAIVLATALHAHHIDSAIQVGHVPACNYLTYNGPWIAELPGRVTRRSAQPA